MKIDVLPLDIVVTQCTDLKDFIESSYALWIDSKQIDNSAFMQFNRNKKLTYGTILVDIEQCSGRLVALRKIRASLGQPPESRDLFIKIANSILEMIKYFEERRFSEIKVSE